MQSKRLMYSELGQRWRRRDCGAERENSGLHCSMARAKRRLRVARGHGVPGR
jgi:hypothetical protein